MNSDEVSSTIVQHRQIVFWAVILASGIFIFDIALPLGVAAGVPYVALVLLGLWHPDKRAVFVLAGVGTLLTVVGYFLSVPAGIHWMVLANRGLALFAIWVTAVLGYQQKVHEETLEGVLRKQEQTVRERTRDLMRENEERARVEAELRSSEQNFRTLMEQASDAIFVFDPDGRALDLNSAAREMLDGSHPSSSAVQSSSSVLVVDDIFEHFKVSDFKASLQAAAPGLVWRFTDFMQRTDGTRISLEISAKRINDGRIHLIARDITERLASEERERIHHAEIARAWRVAAVGEMSTILAHELNQPLTVISGCAQTLQEALGQQVDPLGCADRTVERGLEQIVDQAARASAIIHRVRAFVRKGMPRYEALDINGVINGLADMLRAMGRPYGIQVDLMLDARLPHIFGDGVQVEQVILNLARNALEATHDNGRARIAIATLKTHDGQAEIRIADEGAGISDTDFQRLLDPFFTTKEDGLGMGLAITHSIIEGHGGRLSLVNGGETIHGFEPGCVARVTFPSVKTETADVH